MGVNLSGRSFLKLLDLTTEEIEYLLKLSKNFKDMKRAGVPHRYLEGKNIVLLFQKTSTRTRCAFEVGGMDLGMGVTYLDPGSSQMGKKESIEDTARVLGRMYDGIEFRGFAQDDVEELAAKSGVPVWNGLTTEWHPTQMLADILTVQENFNYDIKGKTLVFMGDCKNNVARSLMVVCSKLGMNFVACGPEECMPADDVIEACKPIAEANGCTIKLTTDVKDGVTGADVIYTDVWVSMGEPDSVWQERIEAWQKRLGLSLEEKEIFAGAGCAFFGNSMGENEKSLEHYLERLDYVIDQVRGEQKEKQKVYQTVSVMCGLIIILLFL